MEQLPVFPEPDQTAPVIHTFLLETLMAHSPFMQATPGPLTPLAPAGHTAPQTRVTTGPIELDRASQESLMRVALQLMRDTAVQMSRDVVASLVADDRLASQVQPIGLHDVSEWVMDRLQYTALAVRDGCGRDVFIDGELDAFGRSTRLPAGGWAFGADLWWAGRQFSLARSASIDRGLYIIVAPQHHLGVASHVTVQLTSNVLGKTEFMSASAEFTYDPLAVHSAKQIWVAEVRVSADEYRAALLGR